MTRDEFMDIVYNELHSDGDNYRANRIIDAADEYVESEKEYEAIKAIPSAESKWIPVSEGLPEEREWIGTKRFGTTISDEVYVTLENSKGERYTRHLSFQNGKLSPADQNKVDALFKGGTPIAWMPLPLPYKAESEEA